MSQIDQLGRHGEPCPSCGSPLAADQRYCLNCGRRRAGPKVDYLRYLVPAAPAIAAAPAEAAPASAEPATPSRRQRDYTPLAAAGGIAVLGLMLLVGVLIGRGNDDGQQVAATPQVVTVGETTAGSSSDSGKATTADTTGGGGGDTTKKATGDKSSGGGGSGGSGKSDLTSKGGGGGESSSPVQASTEDLQALENASPGDYAEQSANLPDTIATPGEAPPVDNEAPGAGSSATTIK